MKWMFVLFFTILLFFESNAQNQNAIDSVKSLYFSSNNDSLKLNALIQLCQKYYYVNPDSAIFYAKDGLDVFGQKKYPKGIATANFMVGTGYLFLEKNTVALDYFMKALSVAESEKYSKLLESLYSNIGSVYFRIGDSKNALDYYTKGLVVAKIGNNVKMVFIISQNIGSILVNEKKYNEAIEHYLSIKDEMGESIQKQDLVVLLANVAGCYSAIEKLDKAEKFANEAVEISLQCNYKSTLAQSYQILSQIYRLRKNYQRSSFYAEKALAIGQDIESWQLIRDASKRLCALFEETNNYKKALFYNRMVEVANDSIFNESKNKEINGLQLTYERERNLKEKALLEKDKALILERSKKQKIIIASITTGLGFLVFMVTFILRRLRITRRQKRIIEEKNVEISAQNTVISQQNDDIVSSITYASRIQSAMIPPVDELYGILPNHFVLFKPRDIVSGDFFWTKRINNQIYIVVADCTGHGVPGAFMSMLGISLLNDILSGSKVIPPHQVLNELRARVIKSLRQTGDAKEAKDGMDIALCLLDMESNILHFAGAKNPLYLIRNGELVEYKADTMPIGIHPALDSKEFTSQTVEISPSDTLYIFSDGYVSQLGGDKYQTFKTKRFQELLRNINGLPMDEQKQTLDKALLDWQGEHRQVDDICVIGFRVGVN